MRLSARVGRIELSTTLALDARAKELVRGGRDVVNMAVGEPDFPTPRAVREAAIAKVRSGDVRYTPAAGLASLREAVAEELTRTRGVEYRPRNVTICHSAKHALSGAILALAGEGDEVLIPLPAWVSYVEMVRITGARPVPVPATPECGMDLAALANAISPRTRAIVICSPSNPSGHVLDDRELRALLDLARAHDLWILSDEIYRRLVYDGVTAASPVSLDPALADRVAIVDGASKAYAMTGYRIGYLAGPPELADAVARLHSQTTGSPNAVSQVAYEAALRHEPEELAAMVEEFARRRTVLVEGLRELGLRLPEPRGAFYAFPNVARHLDGRGSAGFCEDLLERHDLAIVPGSAFGCDTHVRLSYALGLDRIEDALERLGTFLGSRQTA